MNGVTSGVVTPAKSRGFALVQMRSTTPTGPAEMTSSAARPILAASKHFNAAKLMQQDLEPTPMALSEDRPSTAYIHHGTPAFRRTNLALFAAGFATFGLLYCVQPLMPEFSRDYGVSEAGAAMSLSLTTGVLAFAMLFAGALSDAWGRKAVMVASLLSSAVLVLVSAWMPGWSALLAVRTLLGLTLSDLPAVAQRDRKSVV